jgi:hypothetical protein
VKLVDSLFKVDRMRPSPELFARVVEEIAGKRPKVGVVEKTARNEKF